MNPRPPVRKAVSASSSTTVTKSKAGVKLPGGKERNETSLIDGLPANPAYVSVGMKTTKNLGDFNSASISVQITMPCHPDKVDECYQSTSALVEGYINAELDELEGN